MNHKQAVADRFRMIEENYYIFKEKLPSIRAGNIGKWVVVAEGKVADELFASRQEAKQWGDRRYGVVKYSVQEIRAEDALSLGGVSLLG